MTEVLKLIKSSKFKIYKCHSGHLEQYICNFQDDKGEVYKGYGKGKYMQNIYSALGEAVERYAFFNMKPDKVSFAPNKRDCRFISDSIYQYYSPEQISLGLVDYARWDRSITQDWTLMYDLNGNVQYFPFEGFNCSRKFFRPTTSGWAIHEDQEVLVNSVLEVIERDTILRSWLSKDFGFELTSSLTSDSQDLEKSGFLITSYLLKNSIGIPVIISKAVSEEGNEYQIPGGVQFFGTAAGVSIAAALGSSLDELNQKLLWIAIGNRTLDKKFSFDDNPSAFHRYSNMSKESITIFNNEIDSIPLDETKNLNYLDMSSLELVDLIKSIDEKITQSGRKWYYHIHDLSEDLSCNLYAAKSTVIGALPNSFGCDYSLPLFNFDNKNLLNNIFGTCNERYHPFT